MKFEWDIKKAASNERKHKVTFEEVNTVFSDILSITIPDPLHSEAEERFVTIGQSAKQRLFVVVHTDRGDVIRLTFARHATAHERKKYEQSHDYS